MNKSVFAIDIGSEKVRVASAKFNSGRIFLEKIRQADINRADYNTQSVITNAIKSCIDDIEKTNPVDKDCVYVNFVNPYIDVINSSGVFVSKHKKNIINQSDIDKVIESAKDNVDIPQDRFVFDFQTKQWVIDDKFVNTYPINLYGNRIEADVDLITCSSLSKNYIENIASNLSFNIEKMYPCIFSLEGSLLSKKEKEIGVILMDIGSSYTNVIAYKNSQIICVFTYPHGSRDITEEISSNFNISFEDAESIKKEHSVVYLPLCGNNYDIETKQIYTKNYMKISAIDVSTVASNKMMEMLITVKRKIKSFYDDISGFEAGVVITGGGVLHKGCCELARYVFKLPVNLGICEYIEGLDEQFIDPSFSTLMSLLKEAELDLSKELIKKSSNKKFNSFEGGFKDKIKGIINKIIK